MHSKCATAKFNHSFFFRNDEINLLCTNAIYTFDNVITTMYRDQTIDGKKSKSIAKNVYCLFIELNS